MLRRFGVLLLCCAWASFAASAGAQLPGVLDGPGETRPALPSFEPEPSSPGTILPEVIVPKLPSTAGLASGLRVQLREVRFEGVTVLSPEELAEITAPYTGREVTIADLEMLRDEVTLAYVERGYPTSGAVIPDQEIEDGVVTIWAIEGRLEEILVETDGRFRPSAIRDRIEVPDAPVNVSQLEGELELLQQDPRILAVKAELLPSERRGFSVLKVAIREAKPYRVRAFTDNYRAPSIGSYQGSLDVAFPNVTGFGDRLEARYSRTLGLNRVTGRYEWPFARWNTTWDAHMQWSDGDVILGVFDDLGIASELVTVGSTIRHTFYHSARTEAGAFFTGDWRRSQSYLFGEGFAFAPGPDPDNGVARAAILRAGFFVSIRTRRQAFSGRTQVSRGIQALGATNNFGDVPDGTFWSWLTQVQYAARLPWLGAQIVARADLQLADRPLLAMEQLAIGGHDSVRGYRENQIVGDSGVIGSVELRVPVWLRSEGQPILELAPFFDAARSWSHDRIDLLGNPATTFGSVNLFSVGIGARMAITEQIRAQVYWGYRLNDEGFRPSSDLQDRGVHFQISAGFPR
ncbi:MAG: ShlB/FhaC/HecB family hemolysin secretion/activation protein [Myxococcota bacterium]|nr:ShlB/FhaC/HecB family hemolysin secretion/activation protein [Myxococcota bacterium]